MRRGQNEYMRRAPQRRNAVGNRRRTRGAVRRRTVRNLLIGFPAVLLAAGVILLIVYGCVHLRDSAFENDGKTDPTYSAQHGQGSNQEIYGSGGKDNVSGNGNSNVKDNSDNNLQGNSSKDDGVSFVGTNRTPEPTARPSAASPSPLSSPSPLPTPSPEPTSNGHELDDEMVIAIDAGHGGYDGGSVSGDIIEKDINLAVAQEIARLLEEHGGITVVQTRTSDVHVGLQERSDIANEAKCDYFVSVHCNTYKSDSSVKGFECHYNEESSEGAAFAQSVTDEMKQYKDMKIRSVKPNDLAVTRHTYCPAILIEMGFLTNPSDCANLADPDYQKQLAERITKAVLKAAGL